MHLKQNIKLAYYYKFILQTLKKIYIINKLFFPHLKLEIINETGIVLPNIFI